MSHAGSSTKGYELPELSYNPPPTNLNTSAADSTINSFAPLLGHERIETTPGKRIDSAPAHQEFQPADLESQPAPQESQVVTDTDAPDLPPVLARPSPAQIHGFTGAVLAFSIGVFCAGFFPGLLDRKHHLGLAALGLLGFAVSIALVSAGVASSAGEAQATRLAWVNLLAHIGGCLAVAAGFAVGWTFGSDEDPSFVGAFAAAAVLAVMTALWSFETIFDLWLRARWRASRRGS
ncbi:hypothetical protein QBC46DRAFT_412808 [Diplogelasinospora grovesii]|uniref:Uncharacterized protein n=1 Tax=Diplogelasinospora grovesii TaxID=303347 RepID=A0AAN6MYG4_9PEZI|nr:hypothetical protein QBC46DRAFT_412808 [Diplogelasinospora grovesii]